MKTLASILVLGAVALAQTTPAKPSAAPGSQSKPGATQGATKSPGAAPAQTIAPDEGTVTDDTYTSDYFRFRYRFPEDFTVREDFMEGQEDQDRLSYVLFAADAPAHTPSAHQSLVIMADKLTGPPDPAAYLDTVTRDVLKRQGFEGSGDTQQVTLAEKSFARADFAKQNTVQTVLVTVVRGYAVSFILTAPSREEVNALVTSLNSLQWTAAKPAGKPAPKPTPQSNATPSPK